jgi:type I restriction enzyme S subunit
MGEWKEYKLTEVGKLERGRSRHRPRYAFHLYGGPYPFIQTGDIRAANKYIISFNQTYSEAGLAQSRLWPAGTLCITIAANIAEIAILKFDACFPDSVLGFIPDEKKADLHFVFYTLKYFQKELQTFGDGSVQDNINLGTFEQIKFPFASPSEQRAIASVLSSLDDKIDLLHRQNKTLEKVAETLFRQWFVEEAEGSTNGQLGDLVEALFAYPIITPVSLGKRIDVNYRTASRYLVELAKAKVLAESYVGKYHLFINKPLLGLLKE